MGRNSDARQRLVASASELFYERGYHDVGVTDLCEAAGVHKGSFYHFFPSKRDLVLATLERYDERYGLDTWGQCLEAEVAPLDRIRLLFERNYRYQRALVDAGQCVRGCMVGNLALELSGQDETVRGRLSEILQRWASFLQRAIEDAVAAGDLPEVDAAANAQAILAYVEGVVLMAKAHNDPELVARLAEGAVALAGAPAAKQD